MYRTSGIRNRRLQEIISKEIMGAFDEVFDIQSDDPELIAENISDFCFSMDINIDSPLERDLLLYKIMGMYYELGDEDFQYTFDEHGQWILSKMLLYMLDGYESFLKYVEEEQPEEFNDRTPSIEDYWESTLSDDDMEYVKLLADDYFTKILVEVLDEEDEHTNYQEWLDFQKEMFIERVAFFPMMAFEIIDDMTPELLFQDRDFMLIDQFGKEEFEKFKSKCIQDGNELGFMNVSENTQMYTGSERFELD